MNAGPIIRFQIDKIVCIGASKSSGLRPGIAKEIVKETVMSDLFDVSKETIHPRHRRDPAAGLEGVALHDDERHHRRWWLPAELSAAVLLGK
ncbi:hypothetical protein IVA81_17700 [Bradyrhizobium sp. 141]|nr:hypothetical protein [Bradyrhizobium sp. 141]